MFYTVLPFNVGFIFHSLLSLESQARFSKGLILQMYFLKYFHQPV